MESQPPGAKPQSSSAGIGVPQERGVARKYPKPPALGRRFLLLLLNPESWAAAAQYPFWVTLLPLILAVVVSSAVVAASEKAHFFAFVETFAKSYDKEYPKLQINSDGLVSAAPGAVQPFDFHFKGAPFVVDATGKTSFEAVKGDFATLITDHTVYQRVMGKDFPPQPFADSYLYAIPVPGSVFLPAKGETTVIDGSHIQGWVDAHRVPLGAGVATVAFIMKFLAEALWITVMLFLLRPAIMVGAAMGERRLIMPKRAVYRIGAALLVPVVVFAGAMQAAGYSAASMVGGENSLILWYFACAALALWAGRLAQQMYLPKPQRPRTS